MAYRNSSLDMPGRIAHMRALCASEPGPGVLAYVDGKTAGWCSVAPKSTYRALVNSRTIPHVQDEAAWSVVCFVVRPGFRRRGLMHELLEGAVGHAHAMGATVPGRLPGRPWQRARRPDQRLRGDRRVLRGTRIQLRLPDRRTTRWQATLARAPRTSLTSLAAWLGGGDEVFHSEHGRVSCLVCAWQTGPGRGAGLRGLPLSRAVAGVVEHGNIQHIRRGRHAC